MGHTPRWLGKRWARLPAKATTEVKLGLWASALLAAWLWGAPARAETTAALVVMVADEPGDLVSARLERDLRSLGLSVMVLSATPENSSSAAALEHTARGLGGI